MQPNKILVTAEGETYYVKDLDKDFHTRHGFIKKELLKKSKPGQKILTNTGKEFFVLEPSFTDIYKRIKRAPQIMLPKDIAVIVAETSINKNSRIVDAGSGSGALTCFLANLVKEVTTYEKRKEFVEIVKQNIQLLELKNIKIKNKDIYKGIDEKEIDLITLDLQEPWRAVKHAEKSLKTGGFIAVYLPQITQVIEFIKKIKKSKKIIYIKTIETIQREWVFEGKVARPGNIKIGHTGFLVFGRKVKS